MYLGTRPQVRQGNGVSEGLGVQTGQHGAAKSGGGPTGTESTDRRDAGVSLIEVLVAIVLLGMVVTTILVSLRASTKASAIDRDHAIAFSWLQAASDEIYRGSRVPCDVATDPIATYTSYAQAATRPPRWVSSPAHIEVTEVEYLGRTTPDADFEWDASFCFEGVGFEDSPLYTQRVTIQATSPDGDLVKTLQMVKNED